MSGPRGAGGSIIPLYVRAQIAHGLEEAGYGYWGFSPAASPRGGYEVYGVKALGTYSEGYLSYEVGPPVPPRPDASFDPIRPTASSRRMPRSSPCVTPLTRRSPISSALSSSFPIYGPLGFQDSVDVSTGVASGCILALDQGMIMAAIANELADDAMQHAFSDGPVEQAIRPLIAVEEFSAGLPGHLAEQPDDQLGHRLVLAAGGVAGRAQRQGALAIGQGHLQAPQVVVVGGLVQDQHDRPAGPAGQERSGHLGPDLVRVDAVVGQEPLDPPLDAGRLGVAGYGHGELAGLAVLGEGHGEAEVGHGLGLVGTNPTFVS